MGKASRNKKSASRVTEPPCLKCPGRPHLFTSKVTRRVGGQEVSWGMCSWCGLKRPIGHRVPYPHHRRGRLVEQGLVVGAEPGPAPGLDPDAGSFGPAVDGVLSVP